MSKESCEAAESAEGAVLRMARAELEIADCHKTIRKGRQNEA